MTRHILIPIVLLLVFAVNPVDAGNEPQLSYQGVVQDSEGTPLNETRDVRFNVYATPTGGTSLWVEIHTITFVDGVFDVVLGNTTSMSGLPWDQPMWLEVDPEGSDAFAPRTAILPSPYSLRVEELDPSSVGAAQVSSNAITSSKIADGTVVRSLNGLREDLTLVGGANVNILASGDSLLISASGDGGASTLDEAYDGGGTGAGRIITADAGAVEVTGAGGLKVAGDVGIGTVNPGARLHVDSNDTAVRFQQSTVTRFILNDTGNIGIGGITAPNAKLHLSGGQWDLNTTEGDFKIGNSSYRLKIGVALNGGGAGEARIRAEGGNNRLLLGSGTDDVLEVLPQNVNLKTAAGASTVELFSESVGDPGGEMLLRKADGTLTVQMDASEGGTGNEGAFMWLKNGTGGITVDLDGHDATMGSGGSLSLRDAGGTEKLLLAADYAGSGVSRIKAGVMEITGGADLAEQFNIRGPGIGPGTVVCIDSDHPGALVSSSRAYDRRVAGVVSGGGGVRPGMLMAQEGSVADGAHPVALTGRVYVNVDASFGPVEAGDLLTSSPTPGYAMRVSDHARAQGAILGKAMTSLETGRGQVLVLVSLQ